MVVGVGDASNVSGLGSQFTFEVFVWVGVLTA